MSRKSKAVDFGRWTEAYRTVEARLFQYEAIRQAVIEARADSITIHHELDGSSRPLGSHSDRTAVAALKELSPLTAVVIPCGKRDVETVEKPEAWLEVCRFAFSKGGEVAVRRFAKGEHYLVTCRELYISQAKYSVIAKETVMQGAIMAAYKHIVKPMDE